MENQQKKIKAYIAGKVSGLNPDAVHAKFLKKQRELEAAGYEVINPASRIINVNVARIDMNEPPLKEDTHRKEIMGICLYDLSTCDELHLLHDWHDSQGAITELGFARKFGIKVIHPYSKL